MTRHHGAHAPQPIGIGTSRRQNSVTHPALVAATALQRHTYQTTPLQPNVLTPQQIQHLASGVLPSGVRVTAAPARSPGVPAHFDFGLNAVANRTAGSPASVASELFFSLVLDWDATHFVNNRIDFLHQPAFTGTIGLSVESTGRWTPYQTAAIGLGLVNFHVLQDRRNRDLLEIGLGNLGISMQNFSPSAQAGINVEVHLNQSLSLVGAGALTLGRGSDASGNGVVVAGGTFSITLLLHTPPGHISAPTPGSVPF